MKHKMLYLLLCLIPVTGLAGSDLSSLYDEQTLHYWKGRYERNLRWNFEKLVLGSLTPAERRQLGNVHLDLPLRVSGDLAGDPLAFYTTSDQIVMPIQSVKFFDDLALAWAWYQARGQSTEKILEYIAMLRYRTLSEPGLRKLPLPLKALNVPKDAWKRDRRVDAAAQEILKSGIVWIMAHETAHLYFRNPGYESGVSHKQSRHNEIPADRFANEIMRRKHIAPLGMVNYFLFKAYWSAKRSDFSSEQAWREYQQKQAVHLPDVDRIKKMASDLRVSPADYAATEMDIPASIRRVQKMAGSLDQVVAILEHQNAQRNSATRTRAKDFSSPDGARVVLKRTAESREYEGNYHGAYERRTRSGTREQLDVRYVLQRYGNKVTGRYSFGQGDATLKGIIRNGKLHYEWQRGDSFGHGVMRADGLGNINGQWGYDEAVRGGGSIHLKRE
ncbi:MAG TPA: hypothetical protein ENI64_02545 [Gammaproteobacteria bacterium]|nr:hypothetical protein [Gammaproteobacteria bacterium]